MTTNSETTRRFLDLAASRLDATRLRFDELLAPYTTFRIGGPADVMYDATTSDDLANAVLLARETGTPHVILGLGANILVADRGFRGVVIRNCARAFEFRRDDTLWSESGAVVQDLILAAVGRSLSGLEHYIGIPSTVGGAVWQNLHFLSPGPERARTMFIAEIVESCDILSQEGERRRVDPAYLAFGYDTSVFHFRRDVALGVTFRLAPADQVELHRILQENLSWRGARHPWLEIHPSAGSIFKKIEGVGAGRLVDQCGLKGFRVGGAQISFIHANILINLGGATASDVRSLIAHAQAAVVAQHGVRLEPEIGFVGEF
jgi:UDP-N-acetylmuramate dehydrogenase